MPICKIALIQHKKYALLRSRAAESRSAENLRRGVSLLRQAKALGADLAVFPEMWSNGYIPPSPSAFDDPFDPRYAREREAWLAQAVADDGPYLAGFRQAARELGIGAVVTALSRGERAPQNTAFVIGRQGELLLKYAKVHTCDFSLEALLQPGDRFPVCTFDGVRLGVMICFDREFPESARMLMLGGAELILIPNACGMNPARLQQLSTRAFENMAGVAMANYPAPGWGQSCAFSPIVFDQEGNYVPNLIAMAQDDMETILLAEFDIDRLRQWRACEVWGSAYRRPAAYRKIAEP